jgi:metal-responsive CopG/Arc/MetJ family transcriptional regulator
MEGRNEEKIRTSFLLNKDLVEEIDRMNPFATRKEFLDRACKAYLLELKRKKIDEELAAACAQAAEEDAEVQEAWEPATLETWK